MPVGPWKSSRTNKLLSNCFKTGSNGNAFAAIRSAMRGENSLLMRALVKVPAMLWKDVLLFVYKIHFLKSSLSHGTKRPPSSGIGFKMACLKETIVLSFLVLVNFMGKSLAYLKVLGNLFCI